MSRAARHAIAVRSPLFEWRVSICFVKKGSIATAILRQAAFAIFTVTQRRAAIDSACRISFVQRFGSRAIRSMANIQSRARASPADHVS